MGIHRGPLIISSFRRCSSVEGGRDSPDQESLGVSLRDVNEEEANTTVPALRTQTDTRAAAKGWREAARRCEHLAVTFFIVAMALGLQAAPTALAIGACGPPVSSRVACENSRSGNPASDWDISGSGDPSIQGFSTEISVNTGQMVDFKIKAATARYHIDVYRVGYYSGAGARKVATIKPTMPRDQPSCLSEASTGLIDCGNWSVSASWSVPANAVSGVYLARLVRDDTGGASHIIFVVRDDARASNLVFQTSDTTWQAYNRYGGASLYARTPTGRATKVSYNRPFSTRDTNPKSWFFNAEYPMVRWLESNGYDVTYLTGMDVDRRGNLLTRHRAFLSVGHDEYWSGNQRAHVEAARAAGVNLAFFSGNEMFWKTRWEPSLATGTAPYRTLVCYKETGANAVIDPDDPPTWTGTWRDSRFSPPGDGGRPENAVTGTIFRANEGTTGSIEVPSEEARMRFWRHTPVGSLGPGHSATLPFGTLGYEWDEDLDNGWRPPGLVHLSSATYQVTDKVEGFGTTYGSGSVTHHLSLYRDNSGALVFGAGTVQWSWGLDSNHDNGSAPPDPSMRQATVNLLADMGSQPATLQAGLVAASASTDRSPPASTINWPAPGVTVPFGSLVTVSGSAEDRGGGNVGAVEVSVDSGRTWHPAAGRESWRYTFSVNKVAVVIESRAADDSGNLETPRSGLTLRAAPILNTMPTGPSITGTSTSPR